MTVQLLPDVDAAGAVAGTTADSAPITASNAAMRFMKIPLPRVGHRLPCGDPANAGRVAAEAGSAQPA